MGAADAMARTKKRAHALVIPYPTSGFINPALHLARLLHSAGVLVTFVNTEHNRALFLARGRGAADDGFRHEAIPDGLAPAERPRTTAGASCVPCARTAGRLSGSSSRG